ncbi:MAG: hypothetical protein IT301_17205 [Dehalococcoidia bacterium]|nr:hypothetical protein [Dehalococcoidia bacterium]
MHGFENPDALTREHVPAEVAGGRRLVLTCRRCNSQAGSDLESHIAPAKSLADFAGGTLTKPIAAHLVVGQDRIKVNLSASGTTVRINETANASDPAATQRVLSSLGFYSGRASEAQVRLDFGKHHPRKAQIATLKAGYLAAFALLGYRYVAPLRTVRRQIASPDVTTIERFHLALQDDTPGFPVNTLAVGQAVGWGPCLIAKIGPDGVVHPPPLLGTDDEFWRSGACSIAGDAFQFEGASIGWPETREYFLDD